MSKLRACAVGEMGRALSRPIPSAPVEAWTSLEHYQLKWAAVHAKALGDTPFAKAWVEYLHEQRELWALVSEGQRLIQQRLYVALFDELDDAERGEWSPAILRDIIMTIPQRRAMKGALRWLLSEHFEVLAEGYRGQYQFPMVVVTATAEVLATTPALASDAALFERLLDIAEQPSAPMQYAALYAIKHLVVCEPALLTPSLLKRLYSEDPYDQMVLSGLMNHLATQGVDPWELEGVEELWDPIWNYNRQSLVSLHAKRVWRGWALPDVRYPRVIEAYESLKRKDTERRALLSESTGVLTEWLENYWSLLGRPALVKRCWPHIARSPFAERLLLLAMQNPAWEVGAQAVERIKGCLIDDQSLETRLLVYYDKAPYATLILGQQLASEWGRSDVLIRFVEMSANSGGAQLKGKAAESLRRWIQREVDARRVERVKAHLDLWRHLAVDDDIWCTHEVRTMGRNIRAHCPNWVELLGLDKNPLLRLIPDHGEMGYGDFMASIKTARAQLIAEDPGRLIALPSRPR